MEHRNSFFLLIAALCLALVLSAPAQVKTHGTAFGLAVGTAIGDSDPGTDDFSGIYAHGLFRYSLIGPLEGQLGISFPVSLKREDDEFAYRTVITSLDYRLLLRFLNLQQASVYLYGGLGGVYYRVKEQPSQISPETNPNGWALNSPVGLGLQFGLSDRVSLELSGGYNFVYSDDLNLISGDDDGGTADYDNDAYWNAVAGLTFSGEDENADADKDGLTNKIEKQLGTNKNNPDSDGDGLLDGEEFTTHQTEPLKVDSDGDGLSDYDEVKTHNTNPRNADSDGDGLDDKAEVVTYGTDPLKADTDGDGLNDKDEVMTYKTDPKKADTDGDMLSDGDEVLKYKTDPMKMDSDGDGLNDGDEVTTHKTDPNKADTDGGTVNDGIEVNRGSNPLNPDDDVMKVAAGASIVLEGVNFATGKADITAESEVVLEKVYQAMKNFPDVVVEIRGYTDSQGRREANIQLSQRRADAVRQWMIAKGIDGSRMTAKGYGPDNPIADNGTAEGRAKNRRIEFYRIK